MNLQDQIGVLEAGIDQLLHAAAAHAPRADERAAAQPQAEVIDTAGAADADADGAAAVQTVEAANATVTEAAIESAEPAADTAHPAGAQLELLVARPSQNEITLTIGGQTVTLNALQVGQMIEELSNARASMQPEPPPGIPPGWRFASTKNPMMAVQKQSNGDRLLVLRHTGHGWVPFTFSPDIVVQMYMMLTQR